MESEIKFLLDAALQSYVDEINSKFNLCINLQTFEKDYPEVSPKMKNKKTTVKKSTKKRLAIFEFIDRQRRVVDCSPKGDSHMIVFDKFLIDKKSEIVIARKDGSQLTREDCLFCKENGLEFIMRL